MQKRNCNVRFLDAHGLWTEVLSPKEVAKFVLTTKAQTLCTLQGRVTKAHILEQVCCPVRQWRENPQAVLEDVLKHFGSQTLVVRSSSLQEDGFVTANAGKFESLLNVPPTSEALRQAIDATWPRCRTLDEFIQRLLQDYGIEVTESRGRFSYLHPNAKRKVADRRLGEGYRKGSIEHVISEQNHRRERPGRGAEGAAFLLTAEQLHAAQRAASLDLADHQPPEQAGTGKQTKTAGIILL